MPSVPATTPKNWPPALTYLTAPSYSPTLTPTHLTALHGLPVDFRAAPPLPPGPSPLVRIAPINDPAHPAYGQHGLFAARDLKPDSFVIEYLGIVHATNRKPGTTPSQNNESLGEAGEAKDEGGEEGEDDGKKRVQKQKGSEMIDKEDPHAGSDYDLSLCRYSALAIDSAKAGNEARFINDYRGVRERPSAQFLEIFSFSRRERGMAVYVLPAGKSGKGKNGIRKGEEILVSYGKGWWGTRRVPLDEKGEGDGGGTGDGNEKEVGDVKEGGAGWN